LCHAREIHTTKIMNPRQPSTRPKVVSYENARAGAFVAAMAAGGRRRQRAEPHKHTQSHLGSRVVRVVACCRPPFGPAQGAQNTCTSRLHIWGKCARHVCVSLLCSPTLPARGAQVHLQVMAVHMGNMRTAAPLISPHRIRLNGQVGSVGLAYTRQVMQRLCDGCCCHCISSM
jgi:hypothetical protein